MSSEPHACPGGGRGALEATRVGTAGHHARRTCRCCAASLHPKPLTQPPLTVDLFQQVLDRDFGLDACDALHLQGAGTSIGAPSAKARLARGSHTNAHPQQAGASFHAAVLVMARSPAGRTVGCSSALNIHTLRHPPPTYTYLPRQAPDGPDRTFARCRSVSHSTAGRCWFRWPIIAPQAAARPRLSNRVALLLLGGGTRVRHTGRKRTEVVGAVEARTTQRSSSARLQLSCSGRALVPSQFHRHRRQGDR